MWTLTPDSGRMLGAIGEHCGWMDIWRAEDKIARHMGHSKGEVSLEYP